MLSSLFAAVLGASAPTLDPVDVRWTFGAHEPYTMYRRVGRPCTGAIDGNAQWVREWLDWFDAHAPEKMEELGFNFIHSRFYKGMGWEVEKKDFPNVQKFVRNCHAHGVKTLAYVQFGTLYPETLRAERPDFDTWPSVGLDGGPNFYCGQYFRWMPCLNCRAWEDYLKRMCTIALTEGGFDGIMFDNVFDNPCYCARCEKAFREHLKTLPDREERFGFTNLDHILLPRVPRNAMSKMEVKDPVMLAWFRWRADTMTGVLTRLRDHIKSVKPDAVVTANPSPYRSRSRFLPLACNMAELSRALDVIIMQNANFPEVIGKGVIRNRVRELKYAQDQGQRIVALCDDVDHMHADWEAKFLMPMIEDVVFGGIPTDRTTLFPSPEPGFVNRHVFAFRKGEHRRFTAFARAHRAELSAPTVHSVRLFYPEREIFLSERAHQGIVAAEEIFLRNRVPYGYLVSTPERPLAVPDGTEVVVVAGQCTLSDAQVAALADYARRGGRLVVTGDSGRYDDWNAQRRVNPLLPQLEGLPNVACRAEADIIPKATLAWSLSVEPPTDGGRALMADLGRVGWQAPVVFENLPPWAFAEYRRLADGTLAVHLVNYKPEEPIRGARVRVAGGAQVRVETPFEDNPAVRSVAASGELPAFAEYALVTVSAAPAVAGVRVSERFGYDPADSTKFLQAALDSGEKTLVLDRQAGDWYARPLRVTGRKDLTIVFEDGVHLVAKRGEFKSPGAVLLTFDRCTNVTLRGVSPERCGLRMWHDDYLTRDKKNVNAHGYRWSEWRHGLSFLSCANVTLEGISSNESGGDGLYVSTTRAAGAGASCANVVVRNCIFDRNNRQGISVIGARGFLVEDTVLSNTSGTAPEAGIDFEPNHADEAISGVVMRRCRSFGNEGCGYIFALSKCDRTSERTDALFEDCVAVSNRQGFVYAHGQGSMCPDAPMDHGRIVLSRCRFAASREEGLVFRHCPCSKGSLTVRDTVFENNCLRQGGKRKLTDISLEVTAHGVYEPDSYTFENVKVIRPQPGEFLGVTRRAKPLVGKPSVLRGAITSVVAGRTETTVFDEKWNAANFPHRAATESPVARVPADLDRVEIVDACPGRMVEIARPAFFRSTARDAVFYADAAKEVHFKLRQTLIGKRDYLAPRKPVCVYGLGEVKPLDPKGVKMPADPDGAVVAFKVPAKGFYRLSLAPGGNGVAVLATDVPLAYDATDSYVNFVGPNGHEKGKFRRAPGELFVSVPAGADISFLHYGEPAENVGVEIVDPSGRVVRREETLVELNALTFRKAAGGVWTLRALPPGEGVFEDYNLAVSGVPGWLFATPEKMWKTNE